MEQLIVKNHCFHSNNNTLHTYNHNGDIALSKIKTLTKDNNIMLKESYEVSFIKSASYTQIYSNDDNKNTYIVIPKITDMSDMQLAITIAHELGHHQLFESIHSPFTQWFYHSNNEYILYEHEKRAWRKAYDIFINLGITPDEFEDDFNMMQSYALNTYKPRNNIVVKVINSITNPIMNLLKLWVISYLIVGVFIIFSNNNIPIPLEYDFVNHINIFFPINSLFIIVLTLSIMVKMFKLLLKSR